VLQEKEIQRLGGVEFIPVDVRVIAATHIDLEAAMEKGTFRQDLYYRLNGVTIRLPALKDRSDDIPALVEYLLKIHGHRLGYPQASIEPETLTWLQQQPWPGNIRQLENVVCQALLEARQYPIQQSHCVALSHSRSRPASASLSAEETIADLANDVLKRAQKGEVSHPMQAMAELFERALIEQALQVCHGRKSTAAKLLGISRPTLYQKMEHYQLSLAEDGSSARNQT
jgi:DNA-binding NtrC family response regulator